jgi:hypothetical protein
MNGREWDTLVRLGHSLPIHSAPVPNNVRYSSNSDQNLWCRERSDGQEMDIALLDHLISAGE